MTKIQNIENLVVAILMVFLAIIVIICDPEDDYAIILGIISVSWLVQAVRLLLFYFTMARYMVDGRRILLKGVVFFDLAIVTSYISTIPDIYVMIYLVVGMIFFNMIDILHAMDAKKCGSVHWKFKLFAGASGIALAFVCLCNYKNPTLAGYIYAVELLYAAAVKVINSFRRTEMVYIQ